MSSRMKYENNTIMIEIKKNPEKSGKENITDRIISILIDADSNDKDYNNAIEDYKDLGGIDEIAKIMGWDISAKRNWINKIQNVNAIKTN